MASKESEVGGDASHAAERALIERIAGGSRDEFRVLADRYRDRVYSLAYRLTGSPEEAEDVAQEAFLKAYQNLKRFKGHSSFYTWLHRITVNLALSRLKHLSRRGKERTQSLEQKWEDSERAVIDPADSDPNPRERLQEKDLERVIGEALRRLPEVYRVLVVLRDVEEKSYEEIAELTGLPLGTVKSRLHQGRAKLKGMLAGVIV